MDVNAIPSCYPVHTVLRNLIKYRYWIFKNGCYLLTTKLRFCFKLQWFCYLKTHHEKNYSPLMCFISFYNNIFSHVYVNGNKDNPKNRTKLSCPQPKGSKDMTSWGSQFLTVRGSSVGQQLPLTWGPFQFTRVNTLLQTPQPSQKLCVCPWCPPGACFTR